LTPVLKVGLTGGIASGKSLAAAALGRLGVPVVDADQVSHALTARDGQGLAALVQALGPGILDPRGELDRRALRLRIFADAALRARVEALLHPLVFEALEAGLKAAQGPYAVAVIPLLVEKPAARALVDRVLVVDCPEEVQIARLMSRDGETEASARAILAAQSSRAARLAAADDILSNASDAAALDAAAGRLHGFYLELAARGDFRRPGIALP
jgi:dephospho-CoA kinase